MPRTYAPGTAALPQMNSGFNWGSAPLEPWQVYLNNLQSQARRSDADGAEVGVGAINSAELMPVLGKYAQSLGFKGPARLSAAFLGGLVDEQGNMNERWGYEQGQTAAPNVPLDAIGQVLDSQGLGDIWRGRAVGRPHDMGTGDWMAALITSAMVGGAAAGAGAGATGAGVTEGVAGSIPEYSLGAGGTGTGIGGSSSGLGYGGAGGVQTVGGIGTVAPSAGFVGSEIAAGAGLQIPEILKSIPMDVWKSGAQAVLKYIGMNKMGKAYEDAANQFFARGAPYNNLLLQSYGKNFNLADVAGYKSAFDRAADISTRAWSARGGNPANNPGIQANILDDVWTKAYLPALHDYRAGLAGQTNNGVSSATAALLSSVPYSAPAVSAGGTLLEGILNSQLPNKEYDLTVGGVKL